MTRKELLEQQADAIEATLAAHNVSGRVAGGRVTPKVATFKVIPGNAEETDQIHDLAGVLSKVLDRTVRVQRRGAAVDVQLIKPQSDRMPVRSLVEQYKPMLPALSATFGVATDGIPLMAQMTNIDVVGNITAPPSLIPAITLSLALLHRPQELAIPTDIPEIGELEHAKLMRYTSAVRGLEKLIEHRQDSGERRPYVVAVLSEGPKAVLEHGPRVGVHVVEARGGKRWKHGLAVSDNGETMLAVDRQGVEYEFYPAVAATAALPLAVDMLPRGQDK